MTDVLEQPREARLRRLARRGGYSLHKSRAGYSIDNLGGYMIVDVYQNFIVDGERFNLTLDDVEVALKELASSS